MRRWRAAVVATATVALVAPASVAWAGGGGHGGGGHGGGADDQVTEVASGLSGPRQIDQYRGGRLVVAESDSAEVSSVDVYDGDVRTRVTLGGPGEVNPQGVGSADGQFFIALGETGGPDEENPPPLPETTPPPKAPTCEYSSDLPPGPGLVVADRKGQIVARCDLLAAELFFNPDNQSHFVADDPDQGIVDSVSNPFAVLVQDRRVLVADAGANTVWSIDRRSGEIAPFFALPVITTGACEGVPNNPVTAQFPDEVLGCDPTPTGVVEGPDGKIYVSGLSGLTQGEGRVYVLDQRGHLRRTIDKGLNPLTGIAVGRRGTIYVSELFGTVGIAGFAGQPVGQVVRIDREGNRSYASVTLPQGLEIVDGSLYAAANSLVPPNPDGAGNGTVVRIGRDAFGPDPVPPAPAPTPPPAP